MLQLDTIDLYIKDTDGNVHNLSDHIVSYKIKWSVFDSVGTFNAELGPNVNWIPEVLGKEKFFIKICGKSMMTGYVDSWEKYWTKTSYNFRISGRDSISVLMDNCFHDYKIYQSIKIENILENVFKYRMTSKKGKPIDVPYYDYTSSAKRTLGLMRGIDWVVATKGQTFFDFISKLLNSAGLYMFAEPGSDNILIHSFYSASGTTNFDYKGEPADVLRPYTIYHAKNGVGNVKELNVKCDRSKFYNHINVLGSSSSNGVIYNDGGYYLQEEMKYDDPGVVNRNKIIVQDEADCVIWARIPERLVYNISFVQAKNAFGWRYRLPNHSNPNTNEPFFINRSAVLYDEFLFNGDEYPCFVVQVEMDGTKGSGQSTWLTLLPQEMVTKLELVPKKRTKR